MPVTRAARHLSILALAGALLVSGIARGQSTLDNDPDSAPGFTNSVFHTPSVDSINLYNGSLTIPIPIGPTYPIGPKLRLQVLLTYSSRGYDYARGGPTPGVSLLSGDPALGLGWNFTLGAIKITASSFPLTQASTYMAPDGSQHVLSSVGNGYYKTLDATPFYVHDMGAYGYEMWDGDGNHYVFGHNVTGNDDAFNNFVHDFGRGRDGWYLTSLYDPFGNGFNVTYHLEAGPCWVVPYCAPPDPPVMAGGMKCSPTALSWVPSSITLTTGATINVSVDTPQSGGLIRAFQFPVLANGSSTTATWNLVHAPASQNVYTGCNQTITWSTYKLTDIQPPAISSAYHFDYRTCPWLLLSRLTLPTGGTIDYAWGGYSFYHGRPCIFGCNPTGPPPGANILVSQAVVCAGGGTPQYPVGTDCNAGPGYLDDGNVGVVSRIQSDPVSGVAGTTTYTQYSFPFGERGVYASGVYNAQSLTVVVFPPDNDGKVRSKSVLFYSGPNGQLFSPGDRVGADLREADYDFAIPRYESVSQPACATYDYSFCANHALRVTNRTFDYALSGYLPSNRHLMSERTYYGQTLADGTCPTCAYHGVDFSNFSGRNWDRNPFDADFSTGNGRHYNVETHSGNLGGDFRQVATTWSPTASPWFPNLFDKRITTDATGSLNQYFDYDHTALANGFLRGTMTWDSGRGLLLADCLYTKTSQGAVDTHGNTASRYTGTFANWTSEPDPHTCSTATPARPDPASWGGNAGNGDIFATDFTYQNGQKVSARAVNGSSPGGWLKYDVTRDSKTGWITSSRDTAGLQTSYYYDSLGRPTSVTPPGESATAVTYPLTTQTIAQRNGGTGDLGTLVEYKYDGFGRTIRERRRMPGSNVYSKQFTKYDARGYAYFQSEWVAEADWPVEALTANVGVNCSFSASSYPTNVPASAPGTYRACFDPYGRPQLVTGAGYSSQMTISRTDTRQPTVAYYSDTAEASTVACVNGAFASTTPNCSGGSDATTTTTKDAFGRSTSVTEPGGDVSSYGYDVLGKLTSVAQGAQSRIFSYDRFGLLRWEATPEKGTVTYDSVGSLGNVTQQTEPGGLLLSRLFDYAGRLKSVSSSEGRTYVTNTYDEAGRGASPGKLTTSVSTNYALSSPSTVTDSFWYSGTGGRLSTKTEALGGSANLTTTQTFGYNSLGLLSSHTHPRVGSDPAFTVSWTFNAGLPVSELVNGAGVVSGIGYQPSGAVASYTTNNGPGHAVTTTITPDGNLPRPSRIQTSGASSNFDSGPYSYDGAGNIRAVGSDTFTYDLRSRLMSANIYDDGGAYRPETFTYDRYGNTLSRTVDGSNIPFSVDPATNRLTTSTQTQYDLRGNLTLYGVGNYAYDGLSRQTSFKMTGSVDERYLYDPAGERIALVRAGATQSMIANSFYFIPACRLLDTRSTPPALAGGGTLNVTVAGNCGIPPTATSIAANVTSLNAPASGYLNAFPVGLSAPSASTAQLTAGTTRATMAFIGLGGATPSFTIAGGFAAGYNTNIIVDVSGYFVQQSTATPDSYSMTFRDAQNHVATKYTLVGGVATVDKDYVFLGNQLVATWQPSTGYSFFMTDHLGTPRLQTDVNANLVTRAKNRAFGLPLTGALPQQGPEFAAMEKDTSSGNHYDHARFYASWLGRFQVPDLLGGKPEDPQSWNRYAYARNNPLKYLDPDGQAVRLSEEQAKAAADYKQQQSALSALVNPQTIRDNWANGNYWFEVATAGTNTLLSDPTQAMVPAAGMAIEDSVVLGKAGESAAAGIAQKLGEEFGLKTRIDSLTGTAARRFPDGMTLKTLSEVKNAAYVRLTNQLKDFLTFADKNGQQFILYVRSESTKLSKELEELTKQGRIVLRYLEEK